MGAGPSEASPPPPPTLRASEDAILHAHFGMSGNGADPLRALQMVATLDRGGRHVRVVITVMQYEEGDRPRVGTTDYVSVARTSPLGKLEPGEYQIEWLQAVQPIDEARRPTGQPSPPVRIGISTFRVAA